MGGGRDPLLRLVAKQGAVRTSRKQRRVHAACLQDGILESRTVFTESGKVQTLYSNGRELATVYYKIDNRTVDRIEYR